MYYNNCLKYCDGKTYNQKKEFCDIRNESLYSYVTIGSQTWMAENLNYDTLSSYCYYNEPNNCKTYGRLYKWASAMGKSEEECGTGHECSITNFPYQGVCPKGWHLPTNAEWDTLLNTIAQELNLENQEWYNNEIGKYLKSKDGWDENGNGLDIYGFNALPAGNFFSIVNKYNNKGEFSYFWSSTEYNYKYAYSYKLNIEDESLNYDNSTSKVFGYSVRCLMD